MIGASSGDWSPDGRNIVFDADWEEQFQSAIYVKPVAGGSAVKINGNLGPYTSPSPRWSPDGRKIAFIDHHLEGLEDVFELKVMNASPGAVATVVATHRGLQGIGTISWSPDGTRIAYDFTISWPNLVAEIYTVSSTGGAPSLLVSSTINGGYPAWSPDGSKIAFSSNRGAKGIWTIPANGGEPVLLAEGPAAYEFPAWSRDGTRIAFVCERDIWVMSSTGENPTRLTYAPEGEWRPTWSPDGRSLCVSRSNAFIMDLWILRM